MARNVKLWMLVIVDHLLCASEENPSKLFKIEAKKITCSLKAQIPQHIGGNIRASINLFTVQMVEFPLISNSATTGHKLQGETKTNLVISVWSK
jgi:hypothetical protein